MVRQTEQNKVSTRRRSSRRRDAIGGNALGQNIFPTAGGVRCLLAALLLLTISKPAMSLVAHKTLMVNSRNRHTDHIRLQSSSGMNQGMSNVPTDSEHIVANGDNREPVQQRHLRFGGVGRLYQQDNNVEDIADAHLTIVDRLAQSTVAVVGVGGVGSWAAEALCRSGVGNIILIDMDDICISNTNRQLHATSSTVGQLKVEQMRRRLLDINPQCNVTTIFDFVTTDNVDEIVDTLLPEITVCLDAIDGSKEKTVLIAACVARKVPIVTCGGAAGRMDPTKIVCDDITRVSGDRLLASCRKHLRKRHGFARGVPLSQLSKGISKPKIWGIQAIFSTETPKALPNDGDDQSALRHCDGALGTACFVTGTFGFVAASRVVDMIASSRNEASYSS